MICGKYEIWSKEALPKSRHTWSMILEISGKFKDPCLETARRAPADTIWSTAADLDY